MTYRLKLSLWIFDVGYRRMRADALPGWAPQMFVFSMLALTMMASFEFRVPVAWLLAILGSLDLLAALYFLGRTVRQILRLGWLGPTRARWWIELAALNWTLCLSVALFALSQGIGVAALPAWQQAIVVFVLPCAKGLFISFCSSAILGFVIGLLQGKRIRGRSLELVSWFFWWILVIVAACRFTPDAPALKDWIAPGLLILSLIVYCAASILIARQQKKRTPADESIE